MGISPIKSCSSSPYAVPNSNPDPSKFRIIREWSAGPANGTKYLALEVEYPNCTNLEGRKILVYEGWDNSVDLLEALEDQLDPHFSNEGPSPFARFHPTECGWTKALEIMAFMAEGALGARRRQRR